MYSQSGTNVLRSVGRNRIVTIGIHGCIRLREDYNYLKVYLISMLDTQEPLIISDDSSIPGSVMVDYLSFFKFTQYENWTNKIHEGNIRWGVKMEGYILELKVDPSLIKNCMK